MESSSIIIDTLQSKLAEGLPGKQAHFQLSPVATDKYYHPMTVDYREAGVLFLIYPYENRWHTCFIKRSTKDPRDKHAGQISLPGGKVEVSDPDFAYTSTREAQEEIGVHASDISLIGELSPLYVYASNFMVYPFIGLLDYTPTFIRQEEEVADIIPVSINELSHHTPILKRDLHIRNTSMHDVPYYDLQGHMLWGATSMITAEFLTIIRASGVDW